MSRRQIIERYQHGNNWQIYWQKSQGQWQPIVKKKDINMIRRWHIKIPTLDRHSRYVPL